MSESMRTAVVFPGQGSQRAGMVKDFHEVSAEARSVFEEASDACGLDFQAICFGEDERLNLTEFAQPCIVTAEIAIFRAVRALHGLEGEIFGGHSLGEYAALVAAGAVSLADAVRLVRTRGALMQEAVPAGEGAMIAVIGKELTLETLEDRLEGLEVDAANHNSPSQIVISGKAHDVETGGERLSGEGFRCVPLNVSAPFHSRLMRPIEPRFSEELAAIAIDDTAAGFGGIEFHRWALPRRCCGSARRSGSSDQRNGSLGREHADDRCVFRSGDRDRAGKASVRFLSGRWV